MSKLKRCPFCGGEAELAINTEMGGSQYQVKCKNCPVTVGRFWYWKKEEAIKAWNTRKPMDRIVEQLEEQAEECRKYWQEFDDEDSFGGMNAYCDAVKIVKEEGGMNG